jgi:hypothetical protein
MRKLVEEERGFYLWFHEEVSRALAEELGFKEKVLVLLGELGKSVELNVVDEDRGALIDRFRCMFLGRAIGLSSGLIFDEHAGVRKLVLSNYFCE